MSIRIITLLFVPSFVIAFAVDGVSAQDPTQDTGGGPARNFGQSGQVAFSNENSLQVSHSSDGITTIDIAPAADFFVAKNFSIGGVIGFDYTKVGNHNGTRFEIGPRVGYNLSFTNMLGVWPRVGFSYAHSSAGYTVAMGNQDVSTSKSNDSIALNIFVPLMMHPATHFFVGFGPFLDTDLSGDNRVTAYGLRLAIGGWLDM
jgi:hypothetical protein